MVDGPLWWAFPEETPSVHKYEGCGEVQQRKIAETSEEDRSQL